MKIRVILALAFSGLVATAIVACGGGGGLSRSAFVAKADQICKAAPVVKPLGKDAKAQDAVVYATEQAANRQKTVNQLEKLDPSSEIQDDVNQYIDNTRAIVAVFHKEAEAAKKNQQQTFGLLDLGLAIKFFDRDALVKSIGFKVCGTSTGPPPPDPDLQVKADAICKQADQAIVDHPVPNLKGAPTKRDFANIAKSYEGSYPTGKSTIPKLEALKPSPKAQKDWARFLASYKDRMGITGQQLAASKSAGQADFQRLASLDMGKQQIEGAAAQKLGLRLCGVTGTGGV